MRRLFRRVYVSSVVEQSMGLVIIEISTSEKNCWINRRDAVTYFECCYLFGTNKDDLSELVLNSSIKTKIVVVRYE